MKIRIKFSKTGPVKFIGHLDMMRYFQKAIRRAGIDVTYSGGYSPHQVMSFAAPLGVGLESQGEYFDLELNSFTTCDEIKTRLNTAMAEGIQILSVRILPETAGNAMASVAAAAYEVRFREADLPQFDWKPKLVEFLNQQEIMVMKKTKKSMKELDLKPFIFSFEIKEDVILFLVDASSAGNIKPSLILQAFMEQNQQPLSEFALLVTRMETYGYRDDKEQRELIPLEEIGYLA